MPSSNIKALALGECVERIIDFRGRTPSKLGMEWGGGYIKALSANNVRDGYIDFERECYLGSDLLYQKWMTRGDCKEGDIIFTMEAPLGNTAMITDNEKYILSQRVILLSANRNLLLPEYLFHYMRSPSFRKDCLYYATGTTAKGIKQGNLVRIKIPILPIEEQEKVSEILGNFDEIVRAKRAEAEKYMEVKNAMIDSLLSKYSISGES